MRNEAAQVAEELKTVTYATPSYGGTQKKKDQFFSLSLQKRHWRLLWRNAEGNKKIHFFLFVTAKSVTGPSVFFSFVAKVSLAPLRLPVEERKNNNKSLSKSITGASLLWRNSEEEFFFCKFLFVSKSVTGATTCTCGGTQKEKKKSLS